MFCVCVSFLSCYNKFCLPLSLSTAVAPTLPSLRSEVFKPCVEDKDLAFCLNEGECSIIETVAGVHRHCRCKEGYHGLRCDQFVPKTDAILSDPTVEKINLNLVRSSTV
uniref:EGF-like domain-containing protein n=1 Tax=Anabas testudineus TaxID=64144 RepID=A0A7N6AT59_ANATE